MGGGGSTQGTLAAKSDSYDFELAPYLMGWQYEEKFRTKGLSIHDFDLGENIGISMYGVVRLAKHTPTGVWVAVKCLHKREIIRLKQVPSVQIEKEVMMHLNHPFIARSGGATQDANMLYLTVELGAGGDMLSHLHRQPKRRLEERHPEP
ncbi:kinase-like domain-containing protein [Baffinella frigidus]|nr:kinase-like domain-containing protein [Cryptophyta sp. CCMP2293]